MVQTFKLFYLAASVLLLLQLTDAGKTERGDFYYPSYQPVRPRSLPPEPAPLIRNLERLVKSKFVKKAKEALTTVGKELYQFGDEVKERLNTNYQLKRAKGNDANDLIPNAIKNNIIEPTIAVAQVSTKRATKGVDTLIAKGENLIPPMFDIPLALGVATATVAKDKVANIINKVKSYVREEGERQDFRNQMDPRRSNSKRRNNN